MTSFTNGYSVLEELKIDARRHAACMDGWGDSYTNMPGTIDFLSVDAIQDYCQWSGIVPGISDFLCNLAQVVKDNPALKAYAWHFFYRLKTPSFSYGCAPAGFADWPLPEALLGQRAPALPVLVLIGALRHARDVYRSLSYDEALIKDTLGVYASSLNALASKGKVPEIGLPALNWVRLYMCARLFQLGRFNFKLMEDVTAGTVLQNRQTGAKVLLAPDGVAMNSAGHCLQEGDPLAEGGWTTAFVEDSEAWQGYPVSPQGFAFKSQRRFSKSQWKAVLTPGDILIDMHIPAGGGMTPERCIDSFEKALKFFARHFPGRFKPVFVCHSWIFNTQFEALLPESNLAKLMRECYLFPASSYGRDGMFFLFGTDRFQSLSELPRDTSVQRAMLDVLASGRRLRTGGMLLFGEDLNAFGTSKYRNTFPLSIDS